MRELTDLIFSGNFRLANSKKLVEKLINNFKNDFKFNKKTRNLKMLWDLLWRQSSHSANVYIVLAEGD